ncbi:MAG: hypothetical protein WBA57_00585 [Elainellaceae cyanobacterium]
MAGLRRSLLIAITVAIVLMIAGGDRTVQAMNANAPHGFDARWMMPDAQIHPLPEALAQWHDLAQSGDYFDEISPTSAGYLIWPRFPIRVFIESAATPETSSPQVGASVLQRWHNAVVQGVDAWSTYLPIQYVTTAPEADIKIWASAPPLRYSSNGEIERARSAETRYSLYTSATPILDVAAENLELEQDVLQERPQLLPACEIWLSPGQSDQHIAATARHEMGHALGIWGHSPTASDTLYFAQVRSPQPISPRDINTLKRIYEQPTQIGWPWVLRPTETNNADPLVPKG